MTALVVFCSPFLLWAQQHTLEKLWETDTVIAIPESVLPDATGKTFFVSLIDGGGWDVDGKGGVGKLGISGKPYNGTWITGLNAPKGLGRFDNRLYVADISDVVVINIRKGTIEKKINIPGADGLNDITVDAKGIVYVSDSKHGNVYRIEKDVPTLYMGNLPGANGLKASGDGLYILAKKAVLYADASKNLRTITDLPNGGDGVEEVGNGDLIVSEWIGYVYYVYKDGRKEQLLDRHLEKKNTADIYFDPATHILYIPGFNAKTVAAYRVKGPEAAMGGAPRIFLGDGPYLAELKKEGADGATGSAKLASLVKLQADQVLNTRPVSVMEKSATPMSGSKHDYMSQAPYFWYDSSKPNGLPYIRRDGQRNPEINTITDRTNIGKLSEVLGKLALAWWITGDEKYAGKASVLLKRWFFDDSTKMNPNLEYAQAIPGVNNGRGTGIIESISLMHIADWSGLLEGSRSWTAEDAAALQRWYAQYLDWMLNSPNGKDEHAAKNNHGTWYLAQVVDFALFAGDTAKARQLAEEGKALVDNQIKADGRMPLELERTTSLHYSTYNLQAFFALATLSRRTGVDLWNYRNKEGAGIRTALDWLTPYAAGEKKWEYQQIAAYNKIEMHELLLQAARVYGDNVYHAKAEAMGWSRESTPASAL